MVLGEYLSWVDHSGEFQESRRNQKSIHWALLGHIFTENRYGISFWRKIICPGDWIAWIACLIDWLINWLVDWLIDWLIDWLTVLGEFVSSSQCHGFGGNQAWSYTENGEIENDELCLELTSSSNPVRMNNCHRRKEYQEWRYDPATKHMIHVIFNMCLSAAIDTSTPDSMRVYPCQVGDHLQSWELAGYKDDKMYRWCVFLFPAGNWTVKIIILMLFLCVHFCSVLFFSISLCRIKFLKSKRSTVGWLAERSGNFDATWNTVGILIS